MSLPEIGIREVGGVVVDVSSWKRVVVSEMENAVLLDLNTSSSARLTPASAHRLARHLHRLATRVEKRIDARVEGSSE